VRGARNGHTTALFADECQSFLDNVIAGLAQIGSWKDPRIGSQGRPGRSATARIYEFAMDRSSDPPSFELLYPGHVPAGSTGVHFQAQSTNIFGKRPYTSSV
jgi:hypothetical protein